VVSLNIIEELTDKVIKRLVENHRSQEFPRLKKLEDYYNANNEINRRLMKDPSKPNNKISNAYASYITDTLTGYFIGEPISYTSADETLL
jgi:SPP1 family phage portal protein